MAIYSGFSHEKLWFSIAMLVYQRVNHSNHSKSHHVGMIIIDFGTPLVSQPAQKSLLAHGLQRSQAHGHRGILPEVWPRSTKKKNFLHNIRYPILLYIYILHIYIYNHIIIYIYTLYIYYIYIHTIYIYTIYIYIRNLVNLWFLKHQLIKWHTRNRSHIFNPKMSWGGFNNSPAVCQGWNGKKKLVVISMN